MKYIICGTWREIGAAGIFEPFKVELDAPDVQEALNTFVDGNGPYYTKYEHILVANVTNELGQKIDHLPYLIEAYRKK